MAKYSIKSMTVPASQNSGSVRSREQTSVVKRFVYGVTNFLLICFYHVSSFLPRRFLHSCAAVIVTVLLFIKPYYRKNTQANLRAMFQSPVSIWRLWFLTHQIYLNFGRYFVDIFYLRSKTHDELEDLLEKVSGVPEFEKALAQGTGAILLTAHIGNWELGGYFLGRKELPINVVYVPDKFSVLERYRSDSRKMTNVKEITLGSGPLAAIPLIKALKGNEIVAMQADRSPIDKAVPIDFFSKKALFPKGPVLCAMLTGAPVIPVFILSTKKKKYKIIAEKPIFMTGDVRNEADVKQNLRAVAHCLEQMILQYPEQWYCFHPLFTE